MAEHDAVGDALERLEWSDRKAGGVSRAMQVTRRTALTGGAAGLAAALIEACGSSNNSGTGSAKASTGSGLDNSIFGVKGGYRFTFVNHVTTNSFFTPTQNGAHDACKLLNCSYQWTGSTSNSVAQMTSAINTAVGAGVDGIATTVIAKNSFNKPIANAISHGIPVVTYNSNEPGTESLAYIGQDLLLSGEDVGKKIKSLIPGGGKIMVFIATPGSANIQPRLDGIKQILKGTNITVQSEASGALEPQELSTIGAFIGRNLSSYKGYFAVDAGSTEAVARAIQKYKLAGKVKGGGFDLTPDTEKLLHQGVIQFTVDQQPYLQGFLPVLELFLYNASKGLSGTADVNTGLKFLNKKTIAPYATTDSRYEGTGTSPGVHAAA